VRVRVKSDIIATAFEILERIAPPHLERTRHHVDDAPGWTRQDPEQLRREREWSGKVERKRRFQAFRSLLSISESSTADVVDQHVHVTGPPDHVLGNEEVVANRECVRDDQIHSRVSSLALQL
jgi:hypothetical protein